MIKAHNICSSAGRPKSETQKRKERAAAVSDSLGVVLSSGIFSDGIRALEEKFDASLGNFIAGEFIAACIECTYQRVAQDTTATHCMSYESSMTPGRMAAPLACLMTLRAERRPHFLCSFLDGVTLLWAKYLFSGVKRVIASRQSSFIREALNSLLDGLHSAASTF